MAGLLDLFGTQRPVALITGSGAPRLGNCIARTLARRGYQLLIHAKESREAAERTATELSAEGKKAIALIADIADETAVRKLVAEAVDHFGRIDVLVNSAAVWQPKRLEEVTADDVRRYLDINTLGTFLCCQHVGLQMAGQPTGGAIVNLGDWAIVRPYLDYPAYFPSKGAIPALTRSLAVELAQRNPRIRVNAVLPGPVSLPADMPAEEKQMVINGTLVKREGHPQHVADAVVALIENEFINGVCLPVDGGRSIYAPAV